MKNAVSVGFNRKARRNVVVLDHEFEGDDASDAVCVEEDKLLFTSMFSPDQARHLAQRLLTAAEACEVLGNSVVLGGDA